MSALQELNELKAKLEAEKTVLEKMDYSQKIAEETQIYKEKITCEYALKNQQEYDRKIAAIEIVDSLIDKVEKESQTSEEAFADCDSLENITSED